MLNNWSGVGRIANDLQITTTGNGVKVLRFTIAIDKANAKRLKEENKPATNFISCVAWKEKGEFIAQYFQKGSPIAISGSIETRNYDDPNFSGRKVYATEVYVNQVGFVPQQAQSQPQQPKPIQQNQFATVDDYVLDVLPEDLPF